MEGNALTLKEAAFHSDSAARNSLGDSMRRKGTKVEPSLKLNSKPSFNVKDDITVILVVSHILVTSAAVRAVTLMKQ